MFTHNIINELNADCCICYVPAKMRVIKNSIPLGHRNLLRLSGEYIDYFRYKKASSDEVCPYRNEVVCSLPPPSGVKASRSELLTGRGRLFTLYPLRPRRFSKAIFQAPPQQKYCHQGRDARHNGHGITHRPFTLEHIVSQQSH